MRSCLSITAKLLALLFALLFVVTTILVLFLFNVEQQYFNSNTYKEALRERRVYDRISELAAQQVVYSLSYNPCIYNPTGCDINPYMTGSPELSACLQDELGEQAVADIGSGHRAPTEDEASSVAACLDQFGQAPTEEPPLPGSQEFIRKLAVSDWQIIFANLLPPDWLQLTTESIIDQVFVYVNVASGQLSIKISLVELKTRLASEPGLAAFKQILSAQPPCTLEQLEIIKQAATSGKLDQIPLCRPPEELVTAFDSQIRAALGLVAGQLPNEVDLAQPAGSGSQPPPAGDDPRIMLNRIRIMVRLGPLLPVALLALVTIFGVRSARDWLRWWGIPLLSAGLLSAGMALAINPLVNWALLTYVNPRLSPSPLTPELGQTLIALLRSLATPLAMGMGIIAGGLALFGAALTVISFLVKK